MSENPPFGTAITHLPALSLQLNSIPHINSILRDHCKRVLIHTPRISVEQHLHTLFHRGDCLFLGYICDGSFVGGDTAEDGDCKVGAEAGG